MTLYAEDSVERQRLLAAVEAGDETLTMQLAQDVSEALVDALAKQPDVAEAAAAVIRLMVDLRTVDWLRYVARQIVQVERVGPFVGYTGKVPGSYIKVLQKEMGKSDTYGEHLARLFQPLNAP